jgi:hypothetical protein
VKNIGELLNTSVSVNNTKLKNTNTKTLTLVTQTAGKLVNRLNNPTRYELYCKYAWNIPENILWNNLEMAETGKNPVRLFTWLCERSMK